MISVRYTCVTLVSRGSEIARDALIVSTHGRVSLIGADGRFFRLR